MPSRPEHHVYVPARRFPNTGTLAYFLPNSQTIHFNELRNGDVELMRSSDDYRGLIGALGIAFHEVTHWADLVGTVWGRDHLRQIYDCERLLAHVDTPGREYDFHKFVDLRDEQRRLMLPEYYTTIDATAAPHDHVRRWGIGFSAGREFDSTGRVDDSRPILFAKFLDPSNGRQIVRQPLTVGSLLETNAIWSELRTRLEVMGGMPAAPRAAEQVYWRDHLLAELYNVDLTLYTAPVHFLAHYARITDARLAYEMSAAVSNLALNLCPSHHDDLAPPAIFEPWSNLVPAFKSCRNPAFAYAVICANGGPLPADSDVATWIENALNASSLPPPQDLLTQARAEAASRSVASAASPIDVAESYLLEVGLRVFDSRSVDSAVTPGRAEASGVEFPLLFDVDGDLFNLSPRTLDITRFNPVASYDRRVALEEWTANFLSSCR